MKDITTLTWEQTLAALVPLVDAQVWSTVYVDDMPTAAFGDRLRAVDVAPAPATGVEEARLDFGDLAGLVFLRRDEHLRTLQSEDGAMRIVMIAWGLDLERV